MLLTQTWLEILAGAWLCIKNSPPTLSRLALQRGLLRTDPGGFCELAVGAEGQGRGAALASGAAQTHGADICTGGAEAAHVQLRNAQSRSGNRLLMDSGYNALLATLPALGIDKPN